MPYMMGGFPDPDGRARDRRGLRRRRRRPDRARRSLLRPARRRSGHPRRRRPRRSTPGRRSIACSTTCERLADRVPVVLMVYANMVLAPRPGAFAERARRRRRRGAIVPDLPLGGGRRRSREALRGAGLALVPLVAPTTPPSAAPRICAGRRRLHLRRLDTGVTGERAELPAGARRAGRRGQRPAPRSRSRSASASGPPSRRPTVGELADGVIIGSRLVRRSPRHRAPPRRSSRSPASSPTRAPRSPGNLPAR